MITHGVGFSGFGYGLGGFGDTNNSNNVPATITMADVAISESSRIGTIAGATFLGAMMITSKNKYAKMIGAGLLAIALYEYLKGSGITWNTTPQQAFGSQNV